jgi:hypothetical protein
MTCGQYDWQKSGRRLKQEQASEDWKSKNLKNCSNCGVPIQKSTGCNQMFCAHCKQFFDWGDARIYEKQKVEELPYEKLNRARDKYSNRFSMVGLVRSLFL